MSSLSAYGPTARGIVRCIFQGVRDSLRLDAMPVFFLSSVTVRVRAAHCLLLNGLIFLGSILLADYIWTPLLRRILELPSAHSSSVDESSFSAFLHVLFSYAYQLLWLYPLYAISFILNTIWYQDIADHAFIVHAGVTSNGAVAAAASAKSGVTFQKWVATMSDEVYRFLLVTAYMIQVTIVSFVPVIGSTLVFIHLCWLYSLYSFEYKWSLLGWSLEYRLKYFERHWAYFLGFGLPAVTLSLLFPKFISLGLFALAFPVFIILAIIARPTTHAGKSARAAAAAATAAPNTKHANGHVAQLEQPRKTGGTRDVGAHGKSVTSPSAAADVQPAAPVFLQQLPIFRGATWINWCLLQRLQQTRSTKRTASSTAATPAVAQNTR